MRFEDMTSERTKIKYMTDGMLLREMLVDPLLQKYSVIMVDEAHERSISTDLLLGVLKKVRRKRKDLRLIISSATIQAEEFLEYFTSTEADEKEMAKLKEEGKELAKIVKVEGRTFHVDILYLESPCENYLEKAVDTVYSIHTKEAPGDVLVFLTGRDEIDKAISLLADRSSDLHPRGPQILALPLYAGLPSDQQLAVFSPAPENHRKVIFSTNLAEASVTIDGITYVVDSGFIKTRTFSPTSGIEILTATPTSQASANQRAGRAGRTKPGKCFRLYPESAFSTLPLSSSPELQRSNLAPTILQLKALGIDNLHRFSFLSPPHPELFSRALELLFAVDALDDYAKLTRPLGLRMAELPLPPMHAKILLDSVEQGCVSQILSLMAMLTIQDPFLPHAPAISKRAFTADEGDHLTLLNIFTAYTDSRLTKPSQSQWCHRHGLNFRALQRAESVRRQLQRYLQRWYPTVEMEIRSKGWELVTGERVRRCLVGGLFPHTARMVADGTFRLVGSEGVYWAHPGSVMFSRRAEWCVFGEVVEMKGKMYLRDISKVEREWVEEVGGRKGYFRVKEKGRASRWEGEEGK